MSVAITPTPTVPGCVSPRPLLQLFPYLEWGFQLIHWKLICSHLPFFWAERRSPCQPAQPGLEDSPLPPLHHSVSCWRTSAAFQGFLAQARVLGGRAGLPASGLQADTALCFRVLPWRWHRVVAQEPIWRDGVVDANQRGGGTERGRKRVLRWGVEKGEEGGWGHLGETP